MEAFMSDLDNQYLTTNQTISLLHIGRKTFYSNYYPILKTSPTTRQRNHHMLYDRDTVLSFIEPVDLNFCNQRNERLSEIGKRKISNQE